MNNKKLWKIVLLLAVITVFYNFIEGLVSVFFGATDETLALFGFGIDSFIEVLSGIGIWHMVIRIKSNKDENVDAFQFTYIDADGDPMAFPIADLSEIRTVQISMTLEQSSLLAGSVSRTLNKRILCRNLEF